jgi:hypothetical protein
MNCSLHRPSITEGGLGRGGGGLGNKLVVIVNVVTAKNNVQHMLLEGSKGEVEVGPAGVKTLSISVHVEGLCVSKGARDKRKSQRKLV